MKEGFNVMFLLYAGMGGLPVIMWVIALTSPYPGLLWLRMDLGLVLGVGSIILGVIGIKEVVG